MGKNDKPIQMGRHGAMGPKPKLDNPLSRYSED